MWSSCVLELFATMANIRVISVKVTARDMLVVSVIVCGILTGVHAGSVMIEIDSPVTADYEGSEQVDYDLSGDSLQTLDYSLDYGAEDYSPAAGASGLRAAAAAQLTAAAAHHTQSYQQGYVDAFRTAYSLLHPSTLKGGQHHSSYGALNGQLPNSYAALNGQLPASYGALNGQLPTSYGALNGQHPNPYSALHTHPASLLNGQQHPNPYSALGQSLAAPYLTLPYRQPSAASASSFSQSSQPQVSYYEPLGVLQQPAEAHGGPLMYKRAPKRQRRYKHIKLPQKSKKKMKIVSVDRGYSVPGGQEILGKFKSLKACMKACAQSPTCFAGDYNPWLGKCFFHSNYTGCDDLETNKKITHFKKVPCLVTFAPRGQVILGVQLHYALEMKGVHDLSACIDKCASIGVGIPERRNQIINQICFGVDFDFATHRCYFHVRNILPGNRLCGTVALNTPRDLVPHPSTVFIQMCPNP